MQKNKFVEWISVEDEEPSKDEIVLAYDDISKCMSLGKLQYDENDDEIYFCWMFLEKMEVDSSPSHWMSLPSPPKDKL